MASQMASSLGGGDYGLIRGRRIARTEGAHALNAARSAAIDQVIVDTGQQENIKRVWISVLGDTTRETHANLDGVPADKNGRWLLGGISVRWPADISLPVFDRINCLCTIISEFGLTDFEAGELIAEHEILTFGEGKSVGCNHDSRTLLGV